MRILFILADFTYPPRDGIQVNIINLFKYMEKRGHSIDLLAFNRHLSLDDIAFYRDFHNVRIVETIPLKASYAAQVSKGAVRKIVSHFIPETTLIKGDRLALMLHSLLNSTHYDLVHVEGITMSFYLRHITNVPIVFSIIDANSLRQKRLLSKSQTRLEYLNSFFRALIAVWIEKEMLPRATKVHVVSNVDRQYLNRLSHRIDVASIPISSPIELFCLTENDATDGTKNSKTLLFAGDLRVRFVKDGLVGFLQDVYPELKRVEPEIKLNIIGPGKLDGHLAKLIICSEDVNALGWVQDYYCELNKATAVIVPDPCGTGLKNRVLQAMALGKPVVGTEWAFEGFDLPEGLLFLQCKDMSHFLPTIRRLLNEPHLYNYVSRSSKEFAVRNFCIDVIGAKWLNLYNEAISKFTVH